MGKAGCTSAGHDLAQNALQQNSPREEATAKLLGLQRGGYSGKGVLARNTCRQREILAWKIEFCVSEHYKIASAYSPAGRVAQQHKEYLLQRLRFGALRMRIHRIPIYS